MEPFVTGWLKVQEDSSSLKKLREEPLSAVLKYNASEAALGPRKAYTAGGPEPHGQGPSATLHVLVQALLNMKTCKMF